MSVLKLYFWSRLLVCSILFSTPLFSQYRNYWKEVLQRPDSLVGVYYTTLSPNGYLVGTNFSYVIDTNNVIVSKDFGLSFDSINRYKYYEFKPDVFDAEYISYSITNNNKFGRTSDFGKTWTAINDLKKLFPYTSGNEINKFEIDNNGLLYVFYQNGHLIRSWDKGKTWDYLYHPLGAAIFTGTMKVAPKGTIYISIQTGNQLEELEVYKSETKGHSWIRLDTLLNVPKISPRDDRTVRISGVNRYFNIVNNVLYLDLSRLHLRRADLGPDIYEGWYYIFTPRENGLGMDTVFDNGFSFSNSYQDDKGVVHAFVDDGSLKSRFYNVRSYYGRSFDTCKTWNAVTAINYTSKPQADIINNVTGDTMQTLYNSAKMMYLPNGRLLIQNDGSSYAISNFRVPTAPMALGIEHACDSYTVTFTSDTLVSVDVMADPLFIAKVEIDTVRKGIAHRVRISSSSPDSTVHFTITAKGKMGTRVFTDSLVKHYKATSHVNKDTVFVDAGSTACYRWFRNDTALFGAIQPFIKMTTAGDYWCDVFDTTSCVQHKVGLTKYEPTSVSYNDVVNSLFTIYPNPASDNITITHNTEVTGDIEITDVLGNVLLVSDVRHSAATGIVKIEILQLPNGVYGVRLPTSHGVYQTRFVVAR